MSDWYRGVDFANRAQNVGECWIEDDGSTLTAHAGPQQRTYKLMAVDSPFGTTWGFEAGLRGQACWDQYGDGFKSRQTEQQLRHFVSRYKTNEEWRSRSIVDAASYPRKSYFNGGAHIQGSVGLVIVPELLHWLANELAPGQPAPIRIAALQAARLGIGKAVEAHPRLFLYSAVERIRIAANQPLGTGILNSVAGYKQRSTAMQATYELLAANAYQWTGASARHIAVAGDLATIIGSDHTFDAWLAALTAWAHDHNETWDWKAVRVSEEVIGTEGHILILKPSPVVRLEGVE